MALTPNLSIAIATMALMTLLTRVAPFLFFKSGKVPSGLKFVQYYFPATIMTILVIYSIGEKDFSFSIQGSKEIIAIVATAALHLALKNFLVSILGGTVIYMALVNGFS